jgi:RNA polymerase sigma factor (sigma-70 family)
LAKHLFLKDVTASSQFREDVLLWDSLRKGNDIAFSTLYKKYVQSLFNYGMHIHPNRDLIKDCIQELFIKFWEKRESLGSIEKVSFYLFRSFKNLLFHKIEISSKKSPLTQDLIDQMAPELPVENFYINSEMVDQRIIRLKKAVQLLTDRQREVILLRFFQGFEAKEIAEIIKNKFIPDLNLKFRGEDQDLRSYRVDFSKIEKNLYFKLEKNIEEAIGELLFCLKNKLYFEPENKKYRND